MDDFLRDLRSALWSLRRTPLFTAVAIVSPTLAVGAKTAVFSLLNALVWRDAAVRDSQTLIQLSTINASGPASLVVLVFNVWAYQSRYVLRALSYE
jgi:hypothetical protein